MTRYDSPGDVSVSLSTVETDLNSLMVDLAHELK